jgi:RNA polymerase sigma-70 factor (ECF subfamily)
VSHAAHAAAEAVARESYGRALAHLATRARDVALAEDALSEAFVAALRQWPREGVPSNPVGWLVSTAQRRLADGARRRRVRDDAKDAVEETLLELGEQDPRALPDERLRLLFVCAHPAIDPSVRTPLMLQVVLGLDAHRIASAYCVAPGTMGQRLWRAKTKVREAGISFELPDERELPERLGFVLEAIYAAYGTSWDDVTPGTDAPRDLATEALFLARLVTDVLPADAEAKGLLALLQYCEARRDARRAPDGGYVPLSEQDLSRWDAALLEAAARTLSDAARLQRLGPWQLEAAIQSLHVSRRRDGRRDDVLLVQLYNGLVQLAPSLGARVARASAVGVAFGAEAGLEALDHIDDGGDYQPFWAVRAELLRRAGRVADARACFERAAGLSTDDAVRSWLLKQRDPAEGQPP